MRSRCWECEKRLDEADEAVLRAQEARERFDACRLPQAYMWAALKSRELQKAVVYRRPVEELAKRILESTKVILAGPTGVGKTAVTVACLRARAPRCLFVSATELSTFGEEKDALRQRALATPLLLLDDLGQDSSNACSDIVHILMQRHNSGRDTWITTGLSVSQIQARYGDGVWRRWVKEARQFSLGEDS